MKFIQKICPICKKDNKCMVSKPESCWCMNIKVPKILIELVKEEKEKSCICKTCVLEYKENEEEFIKKYRRVNGI